MEPIQQAIPMRRLQRALLVLEGLTYMEDDRLFFDNAQKSAEPFKENKFVSDVYCIAHAALGMCGAREHHDEQWLGKIEEYEKMLKEAGIIDVEESLKSQKEEIILKKNDSE